jgi:acetoin utilization deacetylase AcuC-like enzyme
MRAFHSDRFTVPLPAGHRFPMPKYALLRARVEGLAGLELHEAEPASDGELALAHDPAYVDAVTEGTLGDAAQREIGFPWSPRMVERARHSVGATIAAARAALADGLAANLAGGTHHASADRGGGWCVFNDVAVAARLMQAEWHRKRGAPASLLRVAVIDLDVHQGNGTAKIFRDDPTVFTLSLHGARNFPFRKEASDLDVDLPDGCTDAPYLEALDTALAALWQHHADAPPGLVFYLAGADPHQGDRLGRLKLTHRGLVERDRRVFDACRARGIPVAISMAGGYGRDIADSVTAHENTLHVAIESWRAWQAGARTMEQCIDEHATAA